MTEEVLAAAGEALERGETVALVTIVRTQGSTPQRVGAKMLVYGDGRTVGTIGGGLVATYLNNAGGAWDNAKKVVEVDLKQKGTALHDATVVGDTVGDPFKDTSSVALNPVIKFTTLFGLLAVELAVSLNIRNNGDTTLTHALALLFFLISVFFVWRSFHGMRIGNLATEAAQVPARELAAGSQFPVSSSDFRVKDSEPSLKP